MASVKRLYYAPRELRRSVDINLLFEAVGRQIASLKADCQFEQKPSGNLACKPGGVQLAQGAKEVF